MDLVLIDMDLDESTGIEFCQHLRSTSYARYVPIIIIGSDDEHGTRCIQAYNAGADDFVGKPFVFGICLAKVKYHLKSRAKRQAVSTSMSVVVSAGELPGVLQFLEVEQKTGRLTIKGEAGTAVLCIEQGRLVNASAPNVSGTDVIPEILCWDSTTVLFQDAKLTDEDRKISDSITRVVMNAAVAVDEYRAIQKKLPGADVIFVAGDEELPKDAAEEREKVYKRAIDGYSRDELLHDSGCTERQATMALLGLIEDGMLKVLEPPYHDYTHRCYMAYRARTVDKKLERVREDISNLEFPLKEPEDKPETASANWTEQAPMLLLAGNKPEHGKMILDSLGRIFHGITGKAPAQRKHLGGIVHMRMAFPRNRQLDVVQLPSSLDRAMLAWIDQHLANIIGVVIVASDQDRFNVLLLMRIIRLLRQRFLGVYYHVVPRIIDDGVAIFKMDCEKCGYKLAVDIDGVGDTGICPICNTEITLPDCLDNLAKVLHLPRQVPVVQAQPDHPRHIRDLLLLVLDTIIYTVQHAEAETGTHKRTVEDVKSESVTNEK